MKKNLLLLIGIMILFTAGNIFAQPPSIRWENSLGGSLPDVAQSILQTKKGGCAVAGYSHSKNGDVTGHQGSTSYSDYWICSLDKSGMLTNQVSFGGTRDDLASDIKETTDGGYVIAGQSYSFDGDVTGHHGTGSDYWIVKTNKNLKLQWQKSLGGSAGDFAYAIQQTSDKGFIVAGSSASIDGDVTGHHGTDAQLDAWIVKSDSNGVLQWEKSLGGSLKDVTYAIQQTTDQGYILAGYSYSKDGDVSRHHGSTNYSDCWIVKLDASGNIIWQQSLGGSLNDVATSIQQTSDGGYILGAYSYSDDGNVTGHHGSTANADCWIAKLNASGKIQWEKSLGGSFAESVHAIRQTPDGNYIFCGYTNSSDGDVSSNLGLTDYWVVKLDTQGNILWEKTYGGSGSEIAYSIAATADNGYIVAGNSSSTNGDVTGNHGADDYWIVKLNPDGKKESSGEMGLPKDIVQYPNPASRELNIQWAGGNQGALTICVMDLYGRTLQSEKISSTNSSCIMPLPADITDGIYMVKIELNHQSFQKLFEVQR